jgi:hypothetical protein
MYYMLFGMLSTREDMMQVLSRRQLAAVSGLAFVVLDAVALFLPGSPPKSSDSASHIADTLARHRPQVLAGMYVAGLTVVALLFFLGSVRCWLARERADAGLTIVAIGGATIGIGAQLVGMLLFYGAAFKVAGQHEHAIVRALTDGGNAGIEISKFGFAAFIAGVCLGGRQALPVVVFRAGLVAAAALTVSAVSLFSEAQLTQFGGGLDLVGTAPAIVWIVVLSVLIGRSEGVHAAVAQPSLS